MAVIGALPLNVGPVWGLWQPPSLHECFLSEKWCRQWLSEHEDSRPKKRCRPPDLFAQVDINKKLTPMTKEAIRAAFAETDVLSMLPGKLKDTKFRLELRPDFEPKSSAPRAHGPAQTKLLTDWINEQVALGLYEPAPSGCQWASPLHIAPTYRVDEKGRQTLVKIRICGDYCEVNLQLVKVAQVVPIISDIKRKLSGHSYYARFDMTAGFNAVVLDEASRDVLTVRTPIGLFRPTRLPFGPKNNPSKYQKIVESMVSAHPLFGKNLHVYMDDILIGADSEEELVELIRFVVLSVGERGGTLKPTKIRIGYAREVILGSEVSAAGIRPSPAHVEAVRRIRLPENSAEMKSFLGLLTYFCSHFPWFSERAAPLHELAKPTAKFPSPLPKSVVATIHTFKREMASAPLLTTFNPGRQLYIDSDASLVAAGSCVYHLADDGARQPICYFSKKFSRREASWPPYVREAYALTFALSKARDFVEAAQTTPVVYVDQKPLLWLKKARSPKVVRWVVETLQLGLPTRRSDARRWP